VDSLFAVTFTNLQEWQTLVNIFLHCLTQNDRELVRLTGLIGQNDLTAATPLQMAARKIPQSGTE